MGIFQIIKYEGDNSDFIWKHPTEDFNTHSQLIVDESQEAVFYKNGQALDVFPPGKYTLTTDNIPLLRKLINLPTGGKSPFSCHVYFVNKTIPLDLKWGTDSQISVFDPQFKIILHAAGRGGMGVQISDSKKFIINFVGTKQSFSREDLISYFHEIISMCVKTYLARIMKETSFVIINEHLEDLSSVLKKRLSVDMNSFGVRLINFTLSHIYIPDSDTQPIQDALAIAAKRRIEGYNWVDEQIADIAKRYASNEGAQNSPTGMIAQAPLAFAFGEMLRDTASPMMGRGFSEEPEAFNELINPIKPKNDDKSNKTASFNSASDRLTELEKMKGRIPDELYNKKMQEILDTV